MVSQQALNNEILSLTLKQKFRATCCDFTELIYYFVYLIIHGLYIQ